MLVDNENNELAGATDGNLCLQHSWPGQMRTVYGDHQRFIETYFTAFPGRYFTGDGARRDEDGYYWITGRVDDVLNVSGHRMGTAEIESALVAHPQVADPQSLAIPTTSRVRASMPMSPSLKVCRLPMSYSTS